MSTRIVLESSDIERAITRISHEIVESNHGTENLLLLGIPTRGIYLAKQIANSIQRHYPEFDPSKSVGKLDVTLFRDDIETKPEKVPTTSEIPVVNFENMTVVLVDDVLFTGRTIRAALDALVSFGRPKAVRLAVLVDRGHREFPIRADFVGKNLPTAIDERIFVKLNETDQEQSVVIQQ